MQAVTYDMASLESLNTHSAFVVAAWLTDHTILLITVCLLA
jgi:hypothetical protein